MTRVARGVSGLSSAEASPRRRISPETAALRHVVHPVFRDSRPPKPRRGGGSVPKPGIGLQRTGTKFVHCYGEIV